MAKKKTTTLAKPAENTLAQRPEFLQTEEIVGMEELSKYVIPQRIRIAQSGSPATVLERFHPADVYLAPSLMPVLQSETDRAGDLVEGAQDVILFVPVFFFVEYVTWNAVSKMGSGEPAILARSYDPKSVIAIKSRDPAQREEKTKDGIIRHTEHLCYAVSLLGVDGIADDELMLMTFQRASHSAGMNLAGLLKMRRAPLYGCVVEARVVYKTKQAWNWYELACSNPETISPWVNDPAQFRGYAEQHTTFRDLHSAQKLRVDHDAEDPEDEDKGEF